MAGNRAEIRSHIRSISKTRKITDAMQLISGVMLTREREQLRRVQAYANELRQIVRDALSGVEDIEHPYLRKPDQSTAAHYVLYIGSDLGMCGSYNANLTRLLQAKVPLDVELHVLGTNQYRIIAEEGYHIANEPITSADLERDALRAMAREVLERFAQEEVATVELLYTRFINAVTFEPALIQLLPIAGAPEPTSAHALQQKHVYLEPDASELIERLVRMMMESSFDTAFVEARTSEQASRQMAMKSATDNANELLDKLTLQYNQARQSEITQEITEIVSGADAK